MMKMYLKILCLSLLMSGVAVAENASVQTDPIKLTPVLIKQIKKIKADSSNAYEVEQLIGKPTACLPLAASGEAWVCQWKGDLASARLESTLNITFSAGMISNIVAIDKNGKEMKSAK